MKKPLVLILSVVFLSSLAGVAYAVGSGDGGNTQLFLPICNKEVSEFENFDAAKEYAKDNNCCFPEFSPNETKYPGCGTHKFFQFLRNVINFLTLKLSFALATVFIVAGGFVIMTSAGSPEKYTKGRKMITLSLVGIFIALLAFIIVNSIYTVLTGTGF